MTDPNAMQDMLAKTFKPKSIETQTSNLADDHHTLNAQLPAEPSVVDMGAMKQKLDDKKARKRAQTSHEQNQTPWFEKKLHPFVIAAVIFALAAGLASFEFLGSGGSPI